MIEDHIKDKTKLKAKKIKLHLVTRLNIVYKSSVLTKVYLYKLPGDLWKKKVIFFISSLLTYLLMSYH